MYPGTIFEIEDQSQFQPFVPAAQVNNAPVLFQAFSSDKGPEGYIQVQGDLFSELYGADMSKAFKKHGQPLLQAANIIKSGGILLAKRCVASDSKLANVVIAAKLEKALGGYKVTMLTGAINSTSATTASDIKEEVLENAIIFSQGYGDYAPSDLDPEITFDGSVPVTGTGTVPVDPGGFNLSALTVETKVYNPTAISAKYTFVEGGDDIFTIGATYIAADSTILGKIEVIGTLGEEEDDVFPIVATSVKLAPYVVSGYDPETALDESDYEDIINGTEEIPDEGIILPLWVITDNGRGLSNKVVSVSMDPISSKGSAYTIYNIVVTENGTPYKTLQFAIDPTKMIQGTNISMKNIVNNTSTQITVDQFDENLEYLIGISDALRPAPAANNASVAYGAIDYLFGSDKKGLPITGVTGSSRTLLSNLPLKNGSNGTQKIDYAKAFDGTATLGGKNIGEKVYDLDNMKFSAVVDAWYDSLTKDAIRNLASFREDFVFLRDLGGFDNNGKKTYPKTVDDAIEDTEAISGNKFQAIYGSIYDIYDPNTRKQITVSIGYSLAAILVRHLAGNANAPFAGLLYNFVIPEAIPGTLNFNPVIKPRNSTVTSNYYANNDDIINQKQDLEEVHLNYATYIDGQLVIETEYTSQEATSQFSFLNNVVGIQEAIRAVRARCPKSRYSWLDGADLETYKKDVNSVLDAYSDNFKRLTFEYVADTVYIANKIFYGVIKVQFRDFVQTEYFKVIALPSAV